MAELNQQMVAGLSSDLGDRIQDAKDGDRGRHNHDLSVDGLSFPNVSRKLSGRNQTQKCCTFSRRLSVMTDPR